MKPAPDRDILLFSTADWDNPFWTNKQHVAVELARLGRRVLYIDSVGLRRPSASAQDLKRILRRLWKGLRPPRKVRDGLWVWSPIVIPLQRFRAVRAINRVLFGTLTRFWLLALGLRPGMLWTYNPMTTAFLSPENFGCCLYHCVDEISAQPGMPAAEIRRAEEDLMRRCDVCFVTAEPLLKERQRLNPRTHYLPNVADYAHFSRALDRNTAVHPLLARLPAPRICFVGAISGYKVDMPLVVRLAREFPHCSVVLAGKVGEGDPWTSVEALRGLPNLHLTGPIPYAELPSFLAGADVAILPSQLNDYTMGMFPMKFFEYLAAGRPVVSTRLESLASYAGVAYLAADHDDFMRGVAEALAGRAPALSLRQAAAQEQTYEKRTQRMLALCPAFRKG